MREIINKPYKSKWIGGLYIIITILIALLYLTIYLLAEGLYRTSCSFQALINGTMLFVFSLILITTIGFYTTKYRIKDNVLTSWSPFVLIKIKLKDIKNIEKVMFPFNVRVGASFYCGFFYVPNLGWVRSIITNLRDNILITTRNGKHFMITPSRPERFMKMLKK